MDDKLKKIRRYVGRLPQNLRAQFLSFLPVNTLLDLYDIVDPNVRQILNLVYKRRLYELIGQYEIDNIVEMIPIQSESYWRTLYVAYNSAVSFNNSIRLQELSIGTVVISTEVGIEFENNLPLESRQEILDHIEEYLSQLDYESTFLNSSGLDINNDSSIDNEIIVKTNLDFGDFNNRYKLLFFFLQRLGFEVQLEYGDPYIRSCIGCNLERATLMCKCHQKEYCGKSCAYKDHSF